MRKPTTFVAACILMLSLSGVALADGGITQAPGFTAPPPPDGSTSSMMTGTTNSETAEGQSDGLASELTPLVTWLAESIL